MAVPFSRPRQPHQRRQRQPGAQAQGQIRPQQGLPQVPQYQHPIARFLYGDGQLQLDRVGRLTRITFYALYEAWRLLQDLTPQPQNNQLDYERPLVVNNQSARLVPTEIRGLEQKERRPNGESRAVVPMDIPSSTQFQLEEIDNTNTTSTVVAEVKEDVEVTLADIENIQQLDTVLTNNTNRSASNQLTRAFKGQRASRVNRCVSCSSTEDDDDDLEADLGYFSTNSSLCSDPDTVEDETDGFGDSCNTNDITSTSSDSLKILDCKHSSSRSDPWSQSGEALIQMASAFDISYGASFENERQRAAYEVYQRMRAELLRSHSAAYASSQSVFDLGKAMLSQALLAGLWYMLKKMA